MERIWPFPIPLKGMSFRVRSNQEIISDVIFCEREPNNSVDSKAVAVFSVVNRKHLGYVPTKVAQAIRDQDLPKEGRIVWRAPTLGVLIEI